MARIRTIKPEFWGDEKLSPCSPMTRLVFLGLISMADDAGRVVDNVKVIDAFIFPETSETCRGSVDELSAMGRIRRGKTASGQSIIEITNWSAHQKIEKPNLRAAFPEIVATKEVAEIPRPVGEASGNDRGSVGEASSNHTNDLRPSTNDRRPTTDDPLPGGAKKPRAARPQKAVKDKEPAPHWVRDFGQWWVEHVGAVDFARLGKEGKSAFDTFGLSRMIEGAKIYNDPQEGPPRKHWLDFLGNCAFWVQLAEMPMVDANGNETARMKRIPTKPRVA